METSSDVVDTTKILEKGPEYLRKQMELESEKEKGGMSAVERLAATKPKYVKSQQVVNSTQEPVISLGSASVSSNGSSNRSSNHSGKLERSSPLVAQSSSQERENAVRRSSSKKRPDSLLLYRQKCELLKGSANSRSRRNLTRRLLLGSMDKNVTLPEATDKECKAEDGDTKPTPGGSTEECGSKVVGLQCQELLTDIPQRNEVTEQCGGDEPDPAAVDITQKPGHRRVVEVRRRCRKGVSRSHSDISSRYSKNFADFDAFFKYCGLDGEVIESLGKENFSARSDDKTPRIRSVSTSTSDDDDFSRNSDEDDGLQEDELKENIRQGTSVIERNARIIKWLYSCKNAKETGKKLRDLD